MSDEIKKNTKKRRKYYYNNSNNRKRNVKKRRASKKISAISVLFIFLALAIYGILSGNMPDEIYEILHIEKKVKQDVSENTNTFNNAKLEMSKFEKDDTILQKTYYTIGYNKESKQANWVGYYLSSVRLNESNESRSEDFREDETLSKSWRSLLTDYRKSGYDRGHLAPAADFRFSADAMSETFLLSNMSPQLHEYNAGIWLTAEKIARRNSYESGDLFVVTGPVFYSEDVKTIGLSHVWIPDAFYKVFLVYNDNEKKAIGFIIPHQKGKFNNIAYYATSVDEVEKITGIDFFYNLPDSDEAEIEADFDVSKWVMREYQF